MKPALGDLRRLAAECEITAYRSSGPGGQKKNKTESSVRARHLATGIVRVATESRSQTRNRKLALERVWAELARRRARRTPRVATRPTATARAARLAEKRRQSERKASRRTGPED